MLIGDFISKCDELAEMAKENFESSKYLSDVLKNLELAGLWSTKCKLVKEPKISTM